MAIRVFALSLAMAVLMGCATESPKSSVRAGGLSSETRDAYFLLLMGPKDNPVKYCAGSALKLNKGLTFMQLGKATDQQIEAKLMEGSDAGHTKTPDLRNRQVALWRQYHSPGRLAYLQFEDCQAASGVSSNLGEVGNNCFNLAIIPATSEAQKALGRSKDESLAELSKIYGSKYLGKWLKEVNDDVYFRDVEASSYEAHRRVIASCIRGKM
jgi:hypothetical protein